MKTIENFERALGRPVQWAPTCPSDGAAPRFRRRLAVHPHYAETLNAWYDAEIGVCLGYGRAGADPDDTDPTVFSCLSQDAITNTLAKAVLDGMNVDFEGSHRDSAAMNEAFADLVALFQHFDESGVLEAELGRIRGDLRARSPLNVIAPQMGADGAEGLRSAVGGTPPDPASYRTEHEPHARGNILVSAVFLAFTRIYETRVADLHRIASRGTGVLADGALHPDLVKRLAHEASETARQVLHMCIRALDYLPPTGVTFTHFLRAVVTADYDVVPRDDRRYRVAFVDAFRQHGIAPSVGGTVSVGTLLWPGADSNDDRTAAAEFVAGLSRKVSYWGLPSDREQLWRLEQEWRRDLKAVLEAAGGRLGPVDLGKPFDVLSIDLRERSGPAGDLQLLWVVKVVAADRADSRARAGSTLLIDAQSGDVRYRIDTDAVRSKTTAAPSLLSLADTSPPRPLRERALRVFAFDPTLGVELATAGINEVTLRLRAGDKEDRPLQPGPSGEYVEVIDHDPASGCFYEPIDLDRPHILAQDGLPPSESNPQFHQQMAYAVTMRVIRDFEEALGRRALWSPRPGQPGSGEGDEYVGRLRIYPHALREANAYYSPDKKALLLGYFTAPQEGASDRQTVFTCLSQDIVAHEVTHALLDGMHRRFREPTNPDVLAFHEAFADIVALFEHFSLPDVLRHQIAQTRGDLASQNRLGELAQQFGEATGNRAALRSAIGRRNPDTGAWEPIKPDPTAYERELEPHTRGSILVAAVFDAFLTIYKARVADLLRIATEGTGVLPAGQLHPDLVGRLADEAAAAARRVLHMCIRALDYCPPVDVTFGDYLRALVTADAELDPLDADHRRVAFAEAFRRYGIIPEGVRTLSVDGLLWRPTSAAREESEIVVELVRTWAVDIVSFGPNRKRDRLFSLMEQRRAALHAYLRNTKRSGSKVLAEMDLEAPFEVHSIRPSLGRDWSGRPRFNWIVELTQRHEEFLDPKRPGSTPDYYFRTGSTLVIDAATAHVRYSIRKPLDPARRERQRAFQWGDARTGLAEAYFGASGTREPFAMLHRPQGGMP
jgi:hypothetical protein